MIVPIMCNPTQHPLGEGAGMVSVPRGPILNQGGNLSPQSFLEESSSRNSSLEEGKAAATGAGVKPQHLMLAGGNKGFCAN